MMLKGLFRRVVSETCNNCRWVAAQGVAEVVIRVFSRRNCVPVKVGRVTTVSKRFLVRQEAGRRLLCKWLQCFASRAEKHPHAMLPFCLLLFRRCRRRVNSQTSSAENVPTPHRKLCAYIGCYCWFWLHVNREVNLEIINHAEWKKFKRTCLMFLAIMLTKQTKNNGRCVCVFVCLCVNQLPGRRRLDENTIGEYLWRARLKLSARSDRQHPLQFYCRLFIVPCRRFGGSVFIARSRAFSSAVISDL